MSTTAGNPAVLAAAQAFLLNGLPPDPERFNLDHTSYFHRQLFTAGSTTKLTFFNTAPSNFYESNWADGSGLPTDWAMVCSGFGFSLELGTNVAGAADAQTTPLISGSVTAAMENIRCICEAGRVEVRLGNQRIAGGWGLSRFPAGGGVNISASNNNTATQQGLGMTLGTTNANGYFRFDVPRLIMPRRSLTATVEWGTARGTSGDDFVIGCHLFGVTIYPHNAA